MRRAFLAVVAVAACSQSYGSDATTPPLPSDDAGPSGDAGVDRANESDASVDAAPVRCSPGSPFGNARIVLGPGTTKGVWSGAFLPDEKTMFYAVDVTTDAGPDYDIMRTTRATTADAFDGGATVVELNSKLAESNASVTADGLYVVFTRETDPSFKAGDLFFSTRVSTQVTFSTPQKLSIDTVADDESTPYVLPDRSALWFSKRTGTGSFDLFRADRGGTDFTPASKLDALSTPSNDWYPVVTGDELEVFWSSDRTDGAVGGYDVWAASRMRKDEAFSNVRIVAEISSTASDIPSWISPDACRLYYWTTKSGKREIWVAERTP